VSAPGDPELEKSTQPVETTIVTTTTTVTARTSLPECIRSDVGLGELYLWATKFAALPRPPARGLEPRHDPRDREVTSQTAPATGSELGGRLLRLPAAA
jgi:hypothetical protein